MEILHVGRIFKKKLALLSLNMKKIILIGISLLQANQRPIFSKGFCLRWMLLVAIIAESQEVENY